MVDWSNKGNLTENPATMHISNDDLMKIGSGVKNLIEFIPKVMSHSIGKIHAFKKFSFKNKKAHLQSLEDSN